jgi:sulfur carrier protein ThiS adenylyltransferase
MVLQVNGSPKDLPEIAELEAMMAARHTPLVQQKLKSGKVAIAGLGGLGSNIAVMLARIGVGHLLLVDYDIVELSNLNRQSYYVSHLGLPKTEALKQQLGEINPFIRIETRQIRVSEENVRELFEGYSIVCEAFDQPAAKAMLVNTVLSQMPDVQMVASSGMAGYGSANAICTKRPMKNLYVCGDFKSEAALGNGLMAPRVQICAGHQANMVLRLLLGIDEA